MKSLINIKNRGSVVVEIAVSAVAVLFGIALIVQSFYMTKEWMIGEHNQHQLDIAWSTDRNIATLLEQTKNGMMHGAEANAELEADYLSGENSAVMLEHLQNIPLIRMEYVSMILVLRGEDVLLCTECGEDGSYTFPYGIDTETPCICTDESGENYLALIIQSAHSDLCYAALIDLHAFYRQIAGNELTNNYWLVLYDKNCDLFLQNDEQQSEIRRFTPEETAAREDGYSILARGEETQTILTKKYSYPVGGGPTVDILISVLPSGVNDNGVFAVGIAAECEHIIDLLRQVFWRILISGLLIVFGTGMLLVIYFRNRRRNNEIREQVALLRQQNESMQLLVEKQRSLAHHQRLELIGTLTSGIAHEFNNLLTPIMGNSILSMELLPDGNEEIMDNLTEIYDASSRAKTLVYRISALSRKNNEASFRCFSPDKLLEKVEQMAGTSLPENVEIIRDYNCPEECLCANETQVGQLLLNIVINAFQAMAENGGTLRISTEVDQNIVVFRFHDTGPGISPEALEHIFEPFFTTKEIGHGTGLGLAICHQIAEDHGGTIEAESTVGVGTTFTVRLPAGRKTE